MLTVHLEVRRARRTQLLAQDMGARGAIGQVVKDGAPGDAGAVGDCGQALQRIVIVKDRK